LLPVAPQGRRELRLAAWLLVELQPAARQICVPITKQSQPGQQHWHQHRQQLSLQTAKPPQSGSLRRQLLVAVGG
jgi:hypothetical protein